VQSLRFETEGNKDRFASVQHKKRTYQHGAFYMLACIC